MEKNNTLPKKKKQFYKLMQNSLGNSKANEYTHLHRKGDLVGGSPMPVCTILLRDSCQVLSEGLRARGCSEKLTNYTKPCLTLWDCPLGF